jgi:CBS domain-containing protein
MKVKDVMTKSLIYCTPADPSQQVADLMKKHQVGAVPVVDSLDKKHLLGIVTDRDLCMKLVAEGRAASTPVLAVMTEKPYTCHAEDTLESCESLMRKHKVRRIPVVDEKNQCIGIVAQADVALKDDAQHIQRILSAISTPRSQGRHAGVAAS